MSTYTGLLAPVIAFDWDGTLTNQGKTNIGKDTGAAIDLTPLRECLQRGWIVTVMTCNSPHYVARLLHDRGVKAIADPWMHIKVWDRPGIVLVTGRKVLADLYVDDHGLRWSYGSDPQLIADQIEKAGTEKGAP